MLFFKKKQIDILRSLVQMRECTLSELARASGANVGYTSNLVMRMELEGLAERQNRGTEVIVKATEKGIEIGKIVTKCFEEYEKRR
ncbi:MAG TPA: MarR family transcriptional regulator [Thermoplasmatales archaeon]|nr:MarR family transcriptional regulator [Thermoplasmatales archaeon]